jgi:DNA-binding SARP family transcriptional activator
MLLTTSVPRLMPLTIRRTRLERWLEAYQQSPVRLLFAPAGSGKTSLLVKYATESSLQVAYCSLPVDCDAPGLHERIASAMNLSRTPMTYEALLKALSANPSRCVELIVDDVDHALPDATAELLRLVEEAPQNITLIYAGRSREHVQARRLIARGIASLCDAQALAFDYEEASLFTEACGAPYSDLELRRLLEETDGWALATCSAIRTASAEDVSLMQAYERWRAQSQAFFEEFIASELERVPDEDRQLFRELLSGRSVSDAGRLRQLEARGLFLVEDGGTLRPYRPLRRGIVQRHQSVPRDTGFIPPLMVKMFVSFEATISGREIPWVRRRDQQIVKYLLLKPDGKASRAELASVFWPGTDRHLATQSVRTACSTIRKAFASAVGYAGVDAYFRATPDVQIDLGHIVCDIRRFNAHAADGDASFEREDIEDAAMHYRAADKLYAGRLLEREGLEEWLVPQAQLLQERYLLALERLSQIAMDRGDREEATRYAQRANAVRPDQQSALSLLSRASMRRENEAAPDTPKDVLKVREAQRQFTGV